MPTVSGPRLHDDGGATGAPSCALLRLALGLLCMHSAHVGAQHASVESPVAQVTSAIDQPVLPAPGSGSAVIEIASGDALLAFNRPTGTDWLLVQHADSELFGYVPMDSVAPVNWSGGHCASGDCKNGTGRLVWPHGTSYEGEFVDGAMSGDAELAVHAEDGSYIATLEGMFRDGWPGVLGDDVHLSFDAARGAGLAVDVSLDARGWIARGQAALAEGRASAAVASLTAALERDATSLEARILRAGAFQRLGLVDEALEDSAAVEARLSRWASEAFASIPAGRFRMGDLRGTGYWNERPTHEVTTEAFELGRTEVTFALWDACAADGGCSRKPSDQGWGRGDRPVINVSYDDITTEFIPWLSRRTGKAYRLPSEAEWEYAARAGTETDYPWGNLVGRNNARCGNCGNRWELGQTAPVGSFAANAFGLHDMHGNVYEWTEDCWHDSYHSAPSDGRARIESGDCGTRAIRGGSFAVPSRMTRSAFRAPSDRTTRSYNFGFRLVRE